MLTDTVAAPIGTTTDVARYHTAGFLVVRDVFTVDRVAPLAAEGGRLLGRVDLIDTNDIRCRWQDHAEAGRTATCVR